jgi:hypothetical protein
VTCVRNVVGGSLESVAPPTRQRDSRVCQRGPERARSLSRGEIPEPAERLCLFVAPGLSRFSKQARARPPPPPRPGRLLALAPSSEAAPGGRKAGPRGADDASRRPDRQLAFLPMGRAPASRRVGKRQISAPPPTPAAPGRLAVRASAPRRRGLASRRRGGAAAFRAREMRNRPPPPLPPTTALERERLREKRPLSRMGRGGWQSRIPIRGRGVVF